MQTPSAVVVSDLDGTLLSSVNYSYDEALPALEALREKHIPVVLVSSKTRTEIEVLRRELGLDHPFVVENGGAAYWPAGYFGELESPVERLGPYEVVRWGVSYPELVAALREARRETGANAKGTAMSASKRWREDESRDGRSTTFHGTGIR